MKFWIGIAVTLAIAVATVAFVNFDYFFFAGYTVLMFVMLATAWNILGGYAGYVNFGTPAFFGLGAYTAVVLYKAFAAPLAAADRRRRRDERAARPRPPGCSRCACAASSSPSPPSPWW